MQQWAGKIHVAVQKKGEKPQQDEMDVSYSVYVCFRSASDSLLLCFECRCLSI